MTKSALLTLKVWIPPSRRGLELRSLDWLTRTHMALFNGKYNFEKQKFDDPFVEPNQLLEVFHGMPVHQLFKVRNFGRKSFDDFVKVTECKLMDDDLFKWAERGFVMNSEKGHPANIYLDY